MSMTPTTSFRIPVAANQNDRAGAAAGFFVYALCQHLNPTRRQR